MKPEYRLGEYTKEYDNGKYNDSTLTEECKEEYRVINRRRLNKWINQTIDLFNSKDVLKDRDVNRDNLIEVYRDLLIEMVESPYVDPKVRDRLETGIRTVDYVIHERLRWTFWILYDTNRIIRKYVN